MLLMVIQLRQLNYQYFIEFHLEILLKGSYIKKYTCITEIIYMQYSMFLPALMTFIINTDIFKIWQYFYLEREIKNE